MRLSQILKSERLILIDNSITGEDNFCRDIYDSKFYSHLKKQKLEKQIYSSEKFKEILENPNIYTTKELIKERKNLEKIIGTKIHYLNKLNRKKIKIKRVIISSKKTKDLSARLQHIIYETRRLMQQRQIKNLSKNPEYNSLLKLVTIIEDKISLKRDMNYRFGEREIDTSKQSNTDEKLLTTAYYLSIFSNESPCILTNDHDIRKMSQVITKLIGSFSFLPYNQGFIKKMNNNPFRVYFGNLKQNQEFNLVTDSSKIHYAKEFEIKNKPRQVTKDLKENIENIWRDFKFPFIPNSQIPKGQFSEVLQSFQL